MVIAKTEIKKHLTSILIYSFAFVLLIGFSKQFSRPDNFAEIKSLLEKTELDITNELDRAVFKDAIRNYYRKEKAEKILALFDKYKTFALSSPNEKSENDIKTLDFSIAVSLLIKAFSFFLKFLIIAAMLFYLSESIALARFKLIISQKHRVNKELYELVKNFSEKNRNIRFSPYLRFIKLLFFGIIKISAYPLAFSPVKFFDEHILSPNFPPD